jgi:hypothetical protein
MEDHFVPNFDLIVTNYHYFSSQMSVALVPVDILCIFTFGRINPCEGKWIQNLLL